MRLFFPSFADLKKNFETPPYNKDVSAGKQVQIRCFPPKGRPSPTVTWLKNGVPIDDSRSERNTRFTFRWVYILWLECDLKTRFNCTRQLLKKLFIVSIIIFSGGNLMIDGDNHLIIVSAKLSDAGNYTCVAENLAARRLSKPALVTVHGKTLIRRRVFCSFNP